MLQSMDSSDFANAEVALCSNSPYAVQVEVWLSSTVCYTVGIRPLMTLTMPGRNWCLSRSSSQQLQNRL